MCIRDRQSDGQGDQRPAQPARHSQTASGFLHLGLGLERICLLYTSDAADERSSVDLGGRRIIKKKKKNRHGQRAGQ